MFLSSSPKERSKLSKFSFETMFAFYKEFSEWMGWYLQKSQDNPEYVLHSSLVRRAIIYVCSTFVRVNSNQKSVLHFTENFSGRHCFTTVLASNIAKWKIKSHAPAEQHEAKYIYNDLQLPSPVRINPNNIFICCILVGPTSRRAHQWNSSDAQAGVKNWQLVLWSFTKERKDD